MFQTTAGNGEDKTMKKHQNHEERSDKLLYMYRDLLKCFKNQELVNYQKVIDKYNRGLFVLVERELLKTIVFALF